MSDIDEFDILDDPPDKEIRVSIREYKPGRWQVYFSSTGKRVFVQKHPDGRPLKTKDEAELAAIFIRDLGYNPAKWNKEKSYKLENAIDLWIKLSTCSVEWLEQRRRLSKQFIEFFGKGRDIRHITTMNIKEFRAHLKGKGFSDKHQKTLLGELKALFNFHKSGFKEFPEFPKINVQIPVPKWLNAKQQDEIFEFIPAEDKPVFTFLRYTGCRPNEAGGLLKEHAFLNCDKPYIAVQMVLGKGGRLKPTTKTKRVKTFPVISEVETGIKAKWDGESPFVFVTKTGKPYRKAHLEWIWDRANKQATEKYQTPRCNLYNGLRHSIATQR